MERLSFTTIMYFIFMVVMFIFMVTEGDYLNPHRLFLMSLASIIILIDNLDYIKSIFK